MKIRDNKGSITMFVLIALLFMTGFLIISFGSNVNKSKSAKEQFDIISGIYSHGDGDENAYERAYTAIRRKNAQILTETVENSSSLELTKTFSDTLSNYKMYGNSVQDGIPSPTNPVAIKSVGDKVNIFNNILPYRDLTTQITSKEELLEGLAQGQMIFYGIAHTAVGSEITYKRVNTTYIVVPIENNKTYTMNNYRKVSNNMMLLDENFIQLEYSSSTNTITNSVGAKYLFVYVSNSVHVADGRQTWTLQDILDNLQIEEGTVSTGYTAYGKYRIPVRASGENGETQEFNIILDEPLRKVGDYADYIDFSTGTVVREVQKVVFTGEESIGMNTSNSFYTAPSFPSTISRVNCTHFKGMDLFDNYADDTAGTYPSQSRIYFFPINGFDTVSNFKAWLAEQYSAGTPVTVNYKLETTDNTETIDLPEVSTFEDYTKIEVLTEVAPSKIEVEYYGYTMG